MTNGEISKELVKFIHDKINSIEQLEILLFLFSERSQFRQPAEVAERLYIQPESAKARLLNLRDNGLCVADDQEEQFRYAASGTADKLVSDLAEAYRVRRVTVISLVFSRSIDPITSFSDAFRFRRDD